MDVFAIVNPLSGSGARPDVAARRIGLLKSRFEEAGVAGSVHVTERPRHAIELASLAVAQGARTVLAWGGDGTINEVGSIVAGSAAALAIVPSGSGNGFANEIGVPRDPSAAIDIALHGRDHHIDAGELDGRLFFNIAGIGFDAAIAELFNARGHGRRGLAPYLHLGFRQAWRYRASRYSVVLDDEEMVSDALLIAFANGREYGNRIVLAPHAQMDDGRLEAMVVEDRSPIRRLWAARHLPLGTADKATRVITRSIVSATIRTDGPILYHVDGEVGRAADSVRVSIRPAALRVRVPNSPTHQRTNSRMTAGTAGGTA